MPFARPSAHNFENQPHRTDDEGAAEWLFPTDVCSSYYSIRTLLSASMTNSSSSSDSADDTLEEPNKDQYHTASSAEESEDAVVVQPSFDDHGASEGVASPGSPKSRERQTRSPDVERKEGDGEARNPSSPDRLKRDRGGNHTRNLSALFGATTISDEIGGPEQFVGLEVDGAGRKHRRMFSGDVSNPNLAHRRLNSKGNAVPVPRRHHRENSEGLDMLSAAANATSDELGTAAGADSSSSRPPVAWEHQPRSSLGQVSSGSSSYSHGAHPPPPYGLPPAPHHQNYQMNPPPQRGRGQYHAHHPYVADSRSGYSHYPPHPHNSAYYGHQYGNAPAPPYHYPHRPAEYHKEANEYPSKRPPRQDLEPHHFDRSTPSPPSDWDNPQQRPGTTADNSGASSNHQAVQTFVTAISVGKGKTIVPTSEKAQKNVSTNTDAPHPPVPAEVGHHRNMSSFSSLGTILGSSVFPGNNGNGPDIEKPKSKGHHRSSSSSVSFLNGLDVGLDDANFLRNLQASNASATSTFRNSPPPHPQAQSSTEPLPRSPIATPVAQQPVEPDSGILKLAAGGTSKRVRRKCTTPGCNNRVVQGGLCISHGAKRKTCKHPGCTKNVKKAGLCSTHGPARKRCEFPDCIKVAVQGGRCIAHGAKKKLCSVDGCAKQAILSGMCKKHHDQEQLGKNSKTGAAEEYCRPVSSAHKPTHTRGLSIFQEMSADAVSSLLNDPNAAPKSGSGVL